jgi:hypothetical protein
MELRLPHMLQLFNIFCENDGKENCAQVLEEEVYKIFATKSLNDEHDCNVVSMNSLNIHSTNDDCPSHDKNVSYKHVNFCGVHKLCEDMPYRDDRFCKKHKHDKSNWWLKVIDEFALFIPLLVNFAIRLVILISNAYFFMIESWPNIVIRFNTLQNSGIITT